jgi:hypothetical protein
VKLKEKTAKPTPSNTSQQIKYIAIYVSVDFLIINPIYCNQQAINNILQYILEQYIFDCMRSNQPIADILLSEGGW